MASNEGQSSCVAYLWIFFLVVGIVPGVISNVQLTSNPSTVQQICPGETIEFTCITESSILSWTSDEYIGVGSPLEFLSINPIGTTRYSTTNANTIANLTDINGGILTSTLCVVTSRSSTITCINVDDRTTAISLVLIAAVPSAPQNVMAVGSMEDCMIRVTWDPPANTGRSDYTYRVDVPFRNITTDSNSSTESTLRVPNCADGIPVQVHAVNQFGCMRSNGTMLRLQSGSTITAPSGLSPGAVAGIAIAIACVIIALVIVAVAAIACYEWKVRKQKRESDERQDRMEMAFVQREDELERENVALMHRQNTMEKAFVQREHMLKKAFVQRQDTMEKAFVQDKFVSRLGRLYDTLKQNIPSSNQEAVHDLLDLMSGKKVSSKLITVEVNIKEALKTTLETKVTSAKGIRCAVQRLKKMIPDIMSTFHTELMEVDSSVTIDQLSALKDEDVHEPYCKELIRLVNQASPEKVKDLLQKFFEALQDYEVRIAENDLHKAFETLGETFLSCKKPLQRIQKILVEANRKLQDDSSDSDEPKGSEKKKEVTITEDAKVKQQVPTARKPKRSKKKKEMTIMEDVEEKQQAPTARKPKGSKKKKEVTIVEGVEVPGGKQQVLSARKPKESKTKKDDSSDSDERKGSKKKDDSSDSDEPKRSKKKKEVTIMEDAEELKESSRKALVSKVTSFRRRGSKPFPGDDGLKSDDTADGLLAPISGPGRRPSAGEVAAITVDDTDF